MRLESGVKFRVGGAPGGAGEEETVMEKPYQEGCECQSEDYEL